MAERIARTGDRRNRTNTLKGRDNFKDLGIDRGIILKRIIKVNLEGVESIHLAQEID
jgi:hypothetical protein